MMIGIYKRKFEIKKKFKWCGYFYVDFVYLVFCINSVCI